MNFSTVICQILLMTVAIYDHVIMADDIRSEISIKKNDNFTCVDKESFTAPSKLYCAFQCYILSDGSCFRFSYEEASSQCEVCFSCQPSPNQPNQLTSGVLQYEVTDPYIKEELTKGMIFFVT